MAHYLHHLQDNSVSKSFPIRLVFCFSHIVELVLLCYWYVWIIIWYVRIIIKTKNWFKNKFHMNTIYSMICQPTRNTHVQTYLTTIYHIKHNLSPTHNVVRTTEPYTQHWHNKPRKYFNTSVFCCYSWSLITFYLTLLILYIYLL